MPQLHGLSTEPTGDSKNQPGYITQTLQYYSSHPSEKQQKKDIKPPEDDLGGMVAATAANDEMSTVEPETKKLTAPRTRTGDRIPASAYTRSSSFFIFPSKVRYANLMSI